MSQYLVYLETQGDPMTPAGVTAHVPTLPGASARGRTLAEAKQRIREALKAYLSLLDEAGELVPPADEAFQLEFEEIERSTFLTDYDALRPNEMETLFRWLALSRQELMALVKDLPAERLDQKLDETTPSVREIICHLAEADLWYTDRLKGWPETPLFRLAAARGVALERLRALTEAERAKITLHEGEDWTPRKIMRRMLEFERECLEQIRAVLVAQS